MVKFSGALHDGCVATLCAGHVLLWDSVTVIWDHFACSLPSSNSCDRHLPSSRVRQQNNVNSRTLGIWLSVANCNTPHVNTTTVPLPFFAFSQLFCPLNWGEIHSVHLRWPHLHTCANVFRWQLTAREEPDWSNDGTRRIEALSRARWERTKLKLRCSTEA